MPIFEYEAMNAEGKPVVDTVEAPSQDEAIAKIRENNLFPTRVTPRKAAKTGGAGPRRVRKKTFTIGGVGAKELNTFTRQLSTLTDAGIPVVQALNILESQMRAGALKNVVGSVTDEVEGGSSLSEGMAKFPKTFDELYCNMVKAGEMSGMLDTTLDRLAEFREKAARLKKRVISAMMYPVAVVLMVVLILAGLIKFIIPTFVSMFSEMGIDLPLPTRILLGFSAFVTNYWYLVPAIPIGLIVIYKIITSTRIGRITVDWIKFRIPIFGTIMRKGAIARFTRTFGTLLASGVPILEGLNISRDTSGNAVLARAIQNVHDSVREGDPIAPPLAQSKVCEDMVVNMIDVGEETGNLDAMLMKVADSYDEDVDSSVEGLTSLMEPIIVVFLGAGVGFVVVSLFLPLVSLMSAMA